jgi:hypothetical protein
MSQLQAQYFYCLKSERTVSGSVLNSQLIYADFPVGVPKNLKAARPHGALALAKHRTIIIAELVTSGHKAR